MASDNSDSNCIAARNAAELSVDEIVKVALRGGLFKRLGMRIR